MGTYMRNFLFAFPDLHRGVFCKTKYGYINKMRQIANCLTMRKEFWTKNWLFDKFYYIQKKEISSQSSSL